MLSHIEIRNFQSLHHVSLEMARFTVIVGQSSSGKSAFTRAVRTLTSNARGTSFITHGQRVCTISAVTDRGSVTLKRGTATDDNEYTVVPATDGEQRTYTKLGGAVPEDVSTFIGIAAKDPINYASQFDRPYLLDDSGSEVARVLGALTNVSVIFEAARESNRRKLTASSTLRTRTADLAVISAQAKRYHGLKAQLAAIEAAEQAVAKGIALQRKHQDLAALIEQAEQAEAVASRFAAPKALPDFEPITRAYERIEAFHDVMGEVRLWRDSMTEFTAAMASAAEQVTRLEDEYTAALREAGTCPTCHQPTTDLQGAHAHG